MFSSLATLPDGERRTLLSKPDAPTRASALTARRIALSAVACIACVAGVAAFATPHGARLGIALGRMGSTANNEAASSSKLGCVSRSAVSRSGATTRVPGDPKVLRNFRKPSQHPTFFSRDESSRAPLQRSPHAHPPLSRTLRHSVPDGKCDFVQEGGEGCEGTESGCQRCRLIGFPGPEDLPICPCCVCAEFEYDVELCDPGTCSPPPPPPAPPAN